MSEEDVYIGGTSIQIGQYGFINQPKEIIEYIKYLQNQLQQKENIIKEVREWAKKYSCQFTNDDGELVVSEISFNIQARPCDLFKILEKEVN